MRHIKIKFCLLLLGFGLTAQAQQATTATGGNASGSGGTVAYSVGQVVYTSNTGTTGSENQGVQQPYEIFIDGIKDEATTNISLSVFPNPTLSDLILRVENFRLEKFSYQLFDSQGKFLESRWIIASNTQINMSALASEVYFINVIQENKTVKIFKIVKN